MLKAATFSGRAIGPAIATAANSMVVRVVSCMVEVVGLWVSCSLSEFVESRTEIRFIVVVGGGIGPLMRKSLCGNLLYSCGLLCVVVGGVEKGFGGEESRRLNPLYFVLVSGLVKSGLCCSLCLLKKVQRIAYREIGTGVPELV
jgi:hypothetical protein